MAPILDRKLGLGLMVFAILGAILPVRFASATSVDNAMLASGLLGVRPTQIVKDWDGAYYGGYGKYFLSIP